MNREDLNMINEDNLTDLDMFAGIEDSDQYLFNNENHSSEGLDSEVANAQNSEELNSEDHIVADKKTPNHRTDIVRSTKLPKARIRNIMKMDPDVSIVSADAVFLVTKATELFLETMAKETFTYTAASKRKTIAKKDLDLVINKVDCLCFLEGAMDF
ncbi:DNA polymerase epsilon subunit 4-like [Battus philenor]|uniref:DNA polymerase epsilon subunit 4-like n=1 Tax=Battus philenor TaxID=42288 RepID=UPI0035CF852D